MLLIPLRSDTNASDRPSGAQAGLIFFPWSMFRRISIDPLSRWSRAMRSLPNLSASKSVAGLRSVTNAMVFPSGDQDGSRSAYLSFVRRWRSEPSAFTMNRSDSPPSYPVNTSRFPSGDHDGKRLVFTGYEIGRAHV